MILCNVRFFWFAFVWEVLLLVFWEKQTLKKKSWGGVQLFFYWKEIAVLVFQTSSWGGVTGAGDLVVP